ncbi:MAG: UPF0182 family protein [Candidatus Roizmanbacteria bacterium]|nr:MAG: UPF0182 family protein [Candidatus Roizmanbacteria bacterium]
MNTPKLFSWIGITAVVLFFLFFSTIVSFVTDWWWFSEVGYTEIFIKPLLVKTSLGIATILFASAFLIGNFLLAARSKTSWNASLPEALVGQPIHLNKGTVKKISAILSLIISAFLGIIIAYNWHDILKYFSAIPFGEKDPIFNKDISFYVFSLPVLQLFQSVLGILAFISLLGSIAIYFLRGNLSIIGLDRKPRVIELNPFKKIKIDPQIRIHISVLLFLFLLTSAFGAYISLFKLLITQSGPVFGAAYTDAAVAIPIIKISIAVTFFIALLALFWGISGKLLPIAGIIILYLLVGTISAAAPGVFQKLIVAPNELKMETPFIERNILATRKAYDLDKIEEREIPADKPLTAEDIDNNKLTIKNVRLWDNEQLLSTFSQIQEIRTYYEFASVDNDRYVIDGEIRQIMLSPRELAAESLPNRNWINEKLTFTHGYGVAAGPVNQVTSEGLPVLFVKDLPPKSEKKELEITRPEIYFGELTNDYAIVKTKSKEFDYPKGEENVYANYQGKGGIRLDSLIKRILFAIKFNSLKLFLSNDITNESRILYNRNIRERVAKIAPFLTFDRDPYMAVADGKIYWIFDAYTKTNFYPYSQPLSLGNETLNYIRNSAKVVVNAYDGKMSIYQIDQKDPIIRTYAKIFPNVFQPLSEIPKSLIPHLRYPEDIFTLQTNIYTTYHMDNSQIFYNKEDLWEIPNIPEEKKEQINADAGSQMDPRHMIMKLPGEKAEEYILMLPFTPRNKDNLSAWMVARNDGENYGKLIVYRFPKQKLIFGPKQVISRFNQDAEISRQISLWDQRGSQVIQGPLMVIPIEESLIYVRPLYLKAETGKIPELKRVIVAYENKIAMEKTLEEALARIFGTNMENTIRKEVEVSAEPEPADQTFQDILKQSNNLYEEALNAQREGNWARYGEAIRKLGETLKKTAQ